MARRHRTRSNPAPMAILGGIATVGTLVWLAIEFYTKAHNSALGMHENPSVKRILSSDLPSTARLPRATRNRLEDAVNIGRLTGEIIAERKRTVPPQAARSGKSKWVKKMNQFDNRVAQKIEGDLNALQREAADEIDRLGTYKKLDARKIDAAIRKSNAALYQAFMHGVMQVAGEKAALYSKDAYFSEEAMKRHLRQTKNNPRGAFGSAKASASAIRDRRQAMKKKTKGIYKAGDAPLGVGAMRPMDPQLGAAFFIEAPHNDPDNRGYIVFSADKKVGRGFINVFRQKGSPLQEMRYLTTKKFKERNKLDIDRELAAIAQLPEHERERALKRAERKYDVTFLGPDVSIWRSDPRFVSLTAAYEALFDFINQAKMRSGRRDRLMGMLGPLQASIARYEGGRRATADIRRTKITPPDYAEDALASGQLEFLVVDPGTSARSNLTPGQVGVISTPAGDLYLRARGPVTFEDALREFGGIPGISKAMAVAVDRTGSPLTFRSMDAWLKSIKDKYLRGWIEGRRAMHAFDVSRDPSFPPLAGVKTAGDLEAWEQTRDFVIQQGALVRFLAAHDPRALAKELNLTDKTNRQVIEIAEGMILDEMDRQGYSDVQRNFIFDAMDAQVEMMEAKAFRGQDVDTSGAGRTAPQDPLLQFSIVAVPARPQWGAGVIAAREGNTTVVAFYDGKERTFKGKQRRHIVEVETTPAEHKEVVQGILLAHGIKTNPAGAIFRAGAAGARLAGRGIAAVRASAPRIVHATSRWLKTPAGQQFLAYVGIVAAEELGRRLEKGGRLSRREIKLVQGVVHEKTGVKPTGSAIKMAIEEA